LTPAAASIIDPHRSKMDGGDVFAQFSPLPPELWARILSFVDSYAELRSLCLVSKAISNEAFPLLYERVNVPYDETKAFNLFKLMKTHEELAYAVKVLDMNLGVLFDVEPRREGIEILVTELLRSLINPKESVAFLFLLLTASSNGNITGLPLMSPLTVDSFPRMISSFSIIIHSSKENFQIVRSTWPILSHFWQPILK
jgi:hypothetical protein